MQGAVGRIATMSLLMLAAQPCFAADDIRDIGSPRRDAAAFAGANVRLEFGRGVRARPTARLQLGVTHSYGDVRSTAPTQVHRVNGIELGVSGSGEPRFYVGGQDAREIGRRLGVNGSTRTILIVGGVLVAAVVVGLMTSGGSFAPCTRPGC